MGPLERLRFEWKIEEGLFVLKSVGADGLEWLHPLRSLRSGKRAGLFRVEANGRAYDAAALTCEEAAETLTREGVPELRARFAGDGLEVEYQVLRYPGTTLLEVWPVVRAAGKEAVITRLDSISLPVAADGAQLRGFRGDWGSEFEPAGWTLDQAVMLESRSGRSSKGNHPWFALERGGGGALCGAVAWSGNWVLRFEPLAGGGTQISGGLNDWEFSKTLQPGESMEGPHMMLALGRDLNDAAQQFAAVGRKHWYPRNALAERLPVEWNPWWPYEDTEINEEVFARNVAAAARLGMEVCTLDAGWFGSSDPASAWYEQRGDWDLVNEQRFPHGIRAVADLTHARGMAFGLWCEIEGLGVKARLAQAHPDFPATRQGERLGYVCFGNPAVQEWAFQTLSRLIREYGCDWIKLDFNLDPGAGCDREDHGHQGGDGLYEHYRGYYRTLARVREAFPEAVLENCSSGGLRIDLGMLRQTHLTFLSDPDWPVHDLQIFWGASAMLAPERLLHWGYSEWRSTNPPPTQKFNPRDPRLTPKQFDYYTRISMLGAYGYSQKLPELPDWMRERIAAHNRVYKEMVRRFVREGSLSRLTGQARRSGDGERWAAFQYSLADEHLLFVFRLPGAEAKRAIRLEGLQAGREYRIERVEGEQVGRMKGAELMERGISFSNLVEEDSEIYIIFGI